MKKVVSALTVKQAYSDGKKELVAPRNSTIITPEARTVAKDLGVKLVEVPGSSVQDINSEQIVVDEKLIRLIVEKVIEKLPPEKRQADIIKKAVIDVLSKYSK